MNGLRLIRVLISPSLLSGLLVGMTTAVIVGAAAWLYVGHSPILQDYLFGPYGVNTILLRLPDSGAVLRSWLLGSPATYYVVLVSTAIIAGLTVFTVLQGIRYLMRQGRQVWGDIHNSPEHKAVIRQLFVKLTFRVVSMVGWGVYITLFITTIVPFASVLLQAGVDAVGLDTINGILSIVGSVAIVFVSLHMHIIFMRLILLRPRLFGADNIELSDS